MQEKTCDARGCNKTFTPSSPRNEDGHRFCSRKCRERTHHEKPLWVACRGLNCDVIILQVPRHKKYCSRRCSNHARYHLRRRVEPVERPPRTCAACDEEFVPRDSAHKFCSNRCANRIRMRKYRQDPEVAAKTRESSRKFYDECRDYILERKRQYYQRTKAARLEYQREYRRRKRQREKNGE